MRLTLFVIRLNDVASITNRVQMQISISVRRITDTKA